ncbi:MAG TPA: hypothetical protein VFB34_12260 [Chloroflexota bacterium]|nr:hypothetical protein [Chloroflexota bacterium]
MNFHSNTGNSSNERNTIVSKLFQLHRPVIFGLAVGAGIISMNATAGQTAIAAPTPQTHAAHVTPHRAAAHHARGINWYAVFAGTWIGRAFGDTGACGTEYGQMTTTANQTVVYSVRSENCAWFSVWGKFYAKGSYIHTYWTGASCAPECATHYWTTEWFHVINRNTIEYADSGQTYLYHRVKH